MDTPEFTHLGKHIQAVLDKQGADATVKSVHAEIVERIPSVEVLARALGADSVMDTKRKLDELIANRIARRPLEDLQREIARRKGADAP